MSYYNSNHITITNSYGLPLKTTPTIYIGYDSREHEAVRVLQYTINRHSSPQHIHTRTLNLHNLRRSGLYRRAPHIDSTCWSETNTNQHMKDSFDGRPFSTDFSFSRFLVPMLNNYEGYALFMDCDMYFRTNPYELFRDAIKPSQKDYAVWVVKHHDQPNEETKMYGCPQTSYQKKNWSSFILWNCGHPAHHNLTVDDVNTKPGSWLHSFSRLEPSQIGSVDESWNFLDNHSNEKIIPKNVHFTTGGPWFPGWHPKRQVDQNYSFEWQKIYEQLLDSENTETLDTTQS